LSQDNAEEFDSGNWRKVDGFLVKLTEKLKPEPRLKVELQLPRPLTQHHKAVIEDFLPAFKKVGDFSTVVTRESDRPYRPYR